MSFRSTRWFLGIAVGGAIAFLGNCAVAQITPDSTLPNNSLVTINGSTFNITGGTTAGRNLFHSFQQFSVPTGGTAIFNNAADIQNIFGRVTGGSVSNINGLIKASGTANLFLINPSGIIFGQNASLNVGGSFVGTTANAIQFGNVGFFSATNPEVPSPLLTINPSALLFNQIATAPIQNNSSLSVPDGKSLLLVGGNINMDNGQLNAYGGRVELSGLAAPGSVGIEVNGNNLSLGFPAERTRSDVSLINGASIDVTAAGGGSIAVNARNLEVSGGSALRAGIGPSLGSVDSVPGDITLNATGEIKVVGQGSNVQNNVQQLAVGNSGNINITTGTLKMTNGGQLQASTFGQGNSGNVTINASDTVSFDGTASNGDASGIVSIVLPQSTVGNGGNISINTGTLSLTNGGRVVANTIGRGSTGSVTIDARDRVSLDGEESGVYNLVNSNGIGNSGGIRIITRTLSLTNGAQLNTTTSGMGNAGDVIVEARDRVSLNKGSVFTTVNETASGKGGDISITSGDVSLANGSRIILGTNGQGDAGNARFTTGSLSLTNGSLLNTITNGRGSTGSVTINASDSVSLDGEGSVVNNLVNPNGIGNSGGIRITTRTLSLTNGAGLNTTTSGMGNAGNVMIEARDRVSFNKGSVLTTVNQTASGKGGDISITSGDVSLTNDAQLNTSTSGMGNAGNVMIEARDRVSLNKGFVFTSVNQTASGKAGDISITSGDISLANGSYIILATNGQGDAGNALITTRSLSLTDGSLLTTVSGNSESDAGAIRIKATESVSLSGNDPINRRSTEISSDTLETGTGRAGDITVDTTAFRVRDGAIINARTRSNGTGGSITINSKTFEALYGGELLTTTSGSASAGKITVNATDWVSVNGSDPTFNERRSIFNASGQNLANVEENSGFFVRSSSSGSAGDIEVNAPQIRLDNTGRFSAESTSGNGGNIKLQVGDLLLLRRGSLISATAGTDQFGGNGGNITINAPSGFIVAIPNENSDITANAFSGQGGRVNIDTLSNFFIAPLSRSELENRLMQIAPGLPLDPGLLPTNDITAISQQNPSLSGTVQINTPNIDPARGLVQLPTVVVNTPRLIASGCAAFDTGGSSFTITGRGGLPPSPTEPLTNDVVWTDTRLPVTTSQQHSTLKPVAKPHSKPKAEPVSIVPATGWVFNGKGEVTLISKTSSNTSLGTTPSTCRAGMK